VAHDVETLPRLHELLLKRLEDLGRVPWAAAACHELLIGADTGFEPLSLDSYRNAWQLHPAGQRALVALIDWYNALTPREREVAPEAKLLWSLANRLPKSIDTLHQVRGLPRSLVPVHQQTILSIMRTADTQQAQPTPLLEPPPYATFERLQLDAWIEYVRNAACAKAQVAKELVLAGHRLRRLKDAVAATGMRAFQPAALLDTLGSWQAALVGESLAWCAMRIPLPSAVVP
jgi:ribonuclease D